MLNKIALATHASSLMLERFVLNANYNIPLAAGSARSVGGDPRGFETRRNCHASALLTAYLEWWLLRTVPLLLL